MAGSTGPKKPAAEKKPKAKARRSPPKGKNLVAIRKCAVRFSPERRVLLEKGKRPVGVTSEERRTLRKNGFLKEVD